MSLPYHRTHLLVDETDASGSVSVTRPSDYREHTFMVKAAGAATVLVEVSAYGTDYAPISETATLAASSETFCVRGVFPYMRLTWSGSDAALNVDLVQSADHPAG